jgi:DNA polymerase-3 subunit alpha
MHLHTNNNVFLYEKLVTTRFNKTAQGKLMRLSNFINAEGNYFDAVHFTNLVYQYPANGMSICACYGKITDLFGFCSMNYTIKKNEY